MRRAVTVLVSGCGRIAFAPTSDAAVDAMSDSAVGTVDGAGTDAAAQTRTFGERPGLDFRNVTTDTYLSNEGIETTLNYGGATVLRSEQDVGERILIRIDTSGLPTSTVVISAMLTVAITQQIGAATLTARPILEAWNEGAADGSTGAANYFDRAAATGWASPGAASPGSSGAPIGTAMPTMLGDLVIELDPSTVQGWITSPASNFGVVIDNSSTESVRVASSENTSTTSPMLTITFVP